jgi:hypothetical protein
MTVRRRMTWIIIVNESRKQVIKLKMFRKKQKKLVISVCTKAVRRQKAKHCSFRLIPFT